VTTHLEGLIGRVPTPLGLWLRFVDVTVQVTTNDTDVWTALGRYYAPYVTGPTRTPAAQVSLIQGPVEHTADFVDVPRAPRQRVKEAVCEGSGGRLILKRQTGVVMGLWPGRAFAAGDLRTHLNQAVNLVNACYAKTVMTRGSVLLHASAVARADRAVVLAGVPGAGKSTAALHLVEAGLRFVSNDRVLAGTDGDVVEVRGYPKQPRVNPGTLLHHPRLVALLGPEERAALGGMDRWALWNLEAKRDVDLDAIYGPGTVRLRARMQALVLLKWRLDGRGLDVRRLDVDEALAEAAVFEKDLGVFDLDRAPHAPAAAARYRGVLRRVPVIAVTGAPDFAALVPLVNDLLGGA
jgi:HprK-related kinase B